jgi:hypothetical protein
MTSTLPSSKAILITHDVPDNLKRKSNAYQTP